MSDQPKILNEVEDALFKVDHREQLSEHFASLLFNTDCSDVTLMFDGCLDGIPAHKLILAARSEYFRAQFYGGFREEKQNEVYLHDVASLTSFKLLLRYIYTGQLAISSSQEDIVLDILGLAHKYVLSDLEEAISNHLKSLLTINNVCVYYDTSIMFQLATLERGCKAFIDKNALSILQHESFYTLSAASLKEMLIRDSFCAQEVDIFRAVQCWIEKNDSVTSEVISEILSCVRLSLLSVEDLLKIVRPSNLFDKNTILDAIEEQCCAKSTGLKYRGELVPEKNVATIADGALVTQGDMKKHLLDGDIVNYDIEKGFTRHTIGEEPGIMIELGSQYIVNNIKMLLWDKDERSYSYYIEVSMDNKNWSKVVDYSQYHCRSWQNLHFSPRVVKYIKIVGTRNTTGCVFHLVSFECKYTENSCPYDSSTGLVIPTKNVAHNEASARVVEGVSRNRNALINGDYRIYDWDTGYTCHQLNSGSIIVQLAQPYLVDSMRLLLWDIDTRTYSYYVEVSVDKRNWHMVVDKRNEQCRSWQVIKFQRRPVVYIRIIGTRNTANEVFHCVHFECPSQVVPQVVHSDINLTNSHTNENKRR